MNYKTLKVGTKGEANRLLVESLFRPVNGGTLRAERYDLGKYKAEGSFVGREVQVPETVHALWVETRRDSDGPYKVLFCLSSR